MINLDEAWQSAKNNITFEHRKILRERYQVPMFGALHTSLAEWGILKAQVDDEGFWSQAEDGIDVVVLVTNRYFDGGIEDILAFQPKQPDKWWLLKGQAHWLGGWELGTRLVGCPSFLARPDLTQHFGRTDDALHIYQTPLDWLQNHCDGAVPLCRQAFVDLANVKAPLTFDSHQHMTHSRDAMQCPVPLPVMKVREQAEAVA